MIVKKPQLPIEQNGVYIYPKTVASQVRVDDDPMKTVDQYVDEKCALNVAKSDVLTLEEIQASTNLVGKVASAEAVKSVKNELDNLSYNASPYLIGMGYSGYFNGDMIGNTFIINGYISVTNNLDATILKLNGFTAKTRASGVLCGQNGTAYGFVQCESGSNEVMMQVTTSGSNYIRFVIPIRVK